MRATAEHHEANNLLPAIEITVASNEDEMMIRVQDQGTAMSLRAHLLERLGTNLSLLSLLARWRHPSGDGEPGL